MELHATLWQGLVLRAQGGYNKNSKESSATMEPERALTISPRSLSSIIQCYDANILILNCFFAFFAHFILFHCLVLIQWEYKYVHNKQHGEGVTIKHECVRYVGGI